MTERCVFFLTGVTGFLGKVILEELVRRREELGVERVHIAIRPRNGHSADERFAREVVPSRCFSRLPPGWTDMVDVIESDLGSPGLSSDGRGAGLVETVTHIVHAAASVNFDLPVADAARSNISAALNVLGLAKRCKRLQRMVSVSTAYVTPHDGSRQTEAPEALAHLPRPASSLFEDIGRGAVRERQLLKESGHPNTYTYTKSIAEHLLMERRGDVPLTIIRPSIISASLRQPFPGWIDSVAAFGGFVLMLGAGHLRAVVGRHDSTLDIVPVDEVSTRILEAALTRPTDGDPSACIRHVAAGHDLSPTLIDCWNGIEDYYRANPVARPPTLRYVGPRRMGFMLADAVHHRLPVTVASMWSNHRRRKGRSLKSRLSKINKAFPYFTSNSFDFHVSEPLDEAFEPNAYVRLVCRGIHENVLKQDRSQWVMAGDRRHHPGGAMRWAFRQPHGNLAIRLAAWATTRVLRRSNEMVTVDIPSFERARAMVPDDHAIVVVPSHRSYLDFVLMSYLAFARPDLRIPIPHIAATLEFGKIPVLGRILQALHAFYLRRGTGKPDPDLTKRIHRFMDEGKTLEFFIEGQRSRTREFLPPKRGLLRAIQSTGRPVSILPVAFCYDRIPEERLFAKELAGQPKPRMRLRDLLNWLRRVRKGHVSLGRAHIACGTPVVMDEGSDVHQVSRDIMARLKEATATTTFQLDAYLRHVGFGGMDVQALRSAIEARGGRVLESDLVDPQDLGPHTARTFRQQFMHWFEDEGSGSVAGPQLEVSIAR